MRRLCGEGVRLLPGEISPHARKGGRATCSEKSAKAVVAQGEADEAGTDSEGPNEKDSHQT